MGSIDGWGRRPACGEGVNELDRTADVEDGSGVEVVMWLTSSITEACNLAMSGHGRKFSLLISHQFDDLIFQFGDICRNFFLEFLMLFSQIGNGDVGSHDDK